MLRDDDNSNEFYRLCRMLLFGFSWTEMTFIIAYFFRFVCLFVRFLFGGEIK